MATRLLTDDERRKYHELWKELCEVSSGLTEREIEFIDSLGENQGPWTSGQAEWLEKIHGRVL